MNGINIYKKMYLLAGISLALNIILGLCLAIQILGDEPRQLEKPTTESSEFDVLTCKVLLCVKQKAI